MNKVLSRPLFRQAGGPILPPNPGLNAPPANPVPMPPAMPPQMGPEMPPVAMSPEQAGEAAGAEMEQVGAEYLSGVFSGIDSAETAEDLINALRGDDRPIQSRYQELAMIVGPEDASNTPDSVLALAQPGIMLAMPEVDSGVGMLVEDLASGAEMVTPEGAPTDMGQGVGGLMMAGAGPMDPGPAPMGDMPMGPEMGMASQGLATGGPVVKKFQDGLSVKASDILRDPVTFDQGGSRTRSISEARKLIQDLAPNVDLRKSFTTNLPLIKDLLINPEQRSDYNQAVIAGRMAAGALSNIGKKQNLGEAAAGILMPAVTALPEIAGQNIATDAAARQAALKLASDELSAGRTLRSTITGKLIDSITDKTDLTRDPTLSTKAATARKISMKTNSLMEGLKEANNDIDTFDKIIQNDPNWNTDDVKEKLGSKPSFEEILYREIIPDYEQNKFSFSESGEKYRGQVSGVAKDLFLKQLAREVAEETGQKVTEQEALQVLTVGGPGDGTQDKVIREAVRRTRMYGRFGAVVDAMLSGFLFPRIPPGSEADPGSLVTTNVPSDDKNNNAEDSSSSSQRPPSFRSRFQSPPISRATGGPVIKNFNEGQNVEAENVAEGPRFEYRDSPDFLRELENLQTAARQNAQARMLNARGESLADFSEAYGWSGALKTFVNEISDIFPFKEQEVFPEVRNARNLMRILDENFINARPIITGSQKFAREGLTSGLKIEERTGYSVPIPDGPFLTGYEAYKRLVTMRNDLDRKQIELLSSSKELGLKEEDNNRIKQDLQVINDLVGMFDATIIEFEKAEPSYYRNYMKQQGGPSANIKRSKPEASENNTPTNMPKIDPEILRRRTLEKIKENSQRN
tara:strand:+ start:2780 stop:5356 length:2577 start_codon:yes stop_codon:yes gene_type:complete